MDEQKERTRARERPWATSPGRDIHAPTSTDPHTEFVGYTDSTQSAGKILAIGVDGEEVESVGEGQNAASCWTPPPSTPRAAARWGTPA